MEIFDRLGIFAKFVEKEHLNWHPLPVELAQEVADPKAVWLDAAVFSKSQFARILQEGLSQSSCTVATHPVKYHNRLHFEAAVRHGRALLAELSKVGGRGIPLQVEQAFLFALACHDAFHPGATFPEDLPPGILIQDVQGVRKPHRQSNEEVSAELADHLAANRGFQLPARVLIANLIWATTFGGASPRGKEKGLDRIVPSTLLELGMVVCDIAPGDDFLEWMQDGANVIFGEIGPFPRPTNFQDLIENRIRFADYLLSKLREFDRLAGNPITENLGWRRSVLDHQRQLNELRGPSPNLELKNRILAQIEEVSGVEKSFL